MSTEWDELAEWWRHELEGDPAYQSDVLPILLGGLIRRRMRMRRDEVGAVQD